MNETCWDQTRREGRRHRMRPSLPATFLAMGVTLLLPIGSHGQALEPDRAERTRVLLEARATRQLEETRELQAFHGFRFSDRRGESGITFRNQVVDDAGRHWTPAHYDHGNAVAVADVDGDGRPDLLFLTQLGSNQLWRNLGNGRFEEITALAGVGLKDQISVAASFADLDNDGDPDLIITTVRHGNHCYENLGGGRFREITAEAGLAYSGHSSGVILFDYDRDGLLDVFLCNVGRYTSDDLGPGGFHRALPDAFAGHMHPDRTEFSILYHNLGHNRFEDVSSAAGVRNPHWTGDGTFTDLNQDGFPDLYLANMQGQDQVYLNDGGKRFLPRTSQFFPRTPWGAMGVKFLDYNNDGRMDLFVTDMHSDMTEQQRRLTMRFDPVVERAKSDAWCTTQFANVLAGAPSSYVFGNAFFENRGDHYEERSQELGAETFWPWGISAGDLNADGYEDLFITAGMGFPFRYAINSLLLNDGGRRFVGTEFLLGVEPRAGGKIEIDYVTVDCDGADRGNNLCAGKSGVQVIRGATSTRSSAILDLDGDGDLDIITNEFNDQPQILLSDLSTRHAIHYLQLRLVGTTSNRDGLGATVRVHSGGATYTRFHDGKSGYLAQSSLPLYFGLGEASKVDGIEITWPSGKKQTLAGTDEINRTLTVKEP